MLKCIGEILRCQYETGIDRPLPASGRLKSEELRPVVARTRPDAKPKSMPEEFHIAARYP